MGPLSGNYINQLHHFFEKSADDFPGHIALICDDSFVSFEELECRANQLAHYLFEQQISTDCVVGILLERSIACYVAILAVLKVGAAYVPIEVEYPDDRINYIFADLPFDAVITSSQQRAERNITWPRALVLEEINAQVASQPISRITHHLTDSNLDRLCYVIYTSGSTGKPKGVEITHASICHYVNAASQLYCMTAKDRVYQGFSLAFDASLEELWMAFANGATLIAGTQKELRSGLGLVSFLKQHKVTVFSTVPTLLATLEEQLPDLRLLILGGEICSLHLVKRWSRPGLRIMNTYGPTEACVIATAFECHPEKDVTIGQPLSGYDVVLLDDQLQEVVAGEEGEICIGGMALARGYVNRPESTLEKFILNPNRPDQRLYRTGDLAIKNADGDLHFVGRVDDQIKLRGFRIELTEIEAVIMNYPGVNQAVVMLHTDEQPMLVAYLIQNKSIDLDMGALKSHLRTQLPDYMMPTVIDTLEAYPLLSSGKINRKAFPKPTQAISQKAYIPPVTPLEKEITFIWEQVLMASNVSIDADFFYDLGGHSLHAAQIISSLRKVSALKNISILDLYQNPNIAQLALKFSHANADKQYAQDHAVRDKHQAPKLTYYLCGLGQLFGILLQYAIGSWQLLAVYLFYFWNTAQEPWTARQYELEFITFFLALPILTLVIPIALKWLLIGRVKPGVHPLWGWFYFRWWLVNRLTGSAFVLKYLIGTPLIAIYYRLLGARIGRNCHIGTNGIHVYDLFTLGDDSALGAESKLTGYVVEDGWLKIGAIDIGERCYVGARCVIGLNTQIENNVVIEEMSMVPDNVLLSQSLYYAGSPARPSVLPLDHVTRKHHQEEPSLLQNALYGLWHYLGMVFLMIIGGACFLPGLSFMNYFYEHSNYLTTVFFAIPVAAMICLGCHYLCIYICKKLILDRIKPGQYPIHSLYYLRYWIIKELLDTEDISIMSDSLYLPMYLRLLGAKLGKRVEMGEAPQLFPDLLTIEDGGFAASSVAMGWPQVAGQSISFAPVTIGKKAFAGNVSFLSAGMRIGEGGLLGCLSITPTDNKGADPHSSWLGSPALFLPKRELFDGYSDEKTYNPPKSLYFKRLLIEFIRILIPTTFSLIILYHLFYALDLLVTKVSLLSVAFMLPVVELFLVIGLIGLLVGLKWLLIGKLKPLTKPLWDPFIWKNDLVEFTYSYFMCPSFVDLALGSPFALWVPRVLGSTIGQRVFCDTNAFAEFDLISIGDDVCINSDTLIQTHLYEDRIFKVSHVTIKSGCNVGVGSIVLYNTLMEENATLGSLSLLMKSECLPTNTEWAGIPAQSTLLNTNYQQATVAVTTLVGVEEIIV